MNIANTVITQDNSSLRSMDTSQLLDLFSVDPSKQPGTTTNKSNSLAGKSSARAILEDMDDLWDEKQYETEYNLDAFMSSLKEWM